jgi:flagellar motor protein MotB
MSRRWIGVLSVLVAFSLAGCSSDWQERYEQSQRENLDLVQQMEELRGVQATDAAKTEAARAQMTAMEREQARLLEERNEAARRAAEYKALLEKSPAAPAVAQEPTRGSKDAKDLYRELVNVYGPGSVTITEQGDVEVTLASDVTFASGSDQLSEAAKKALRRVAPKLNGEFGSYLIRIEGHTDNDPVVRTKDKFHDNLGLSTARANSVARFMQDELKISPQRLMSAGRGENEPIADNKSASGKAKNRRVEIVVVTSAQAK